MSQQTCGYGLRPPWQSRTLVKRGIMDTEYDETPIDFPSYSEINLTLRSIETINCDGEDSSIRLACRASNGSKVWINIDGLSIGMILDAVLKTRD